MAMEHLGQQNFLNIEMGTDRSVFCSYIFFAILVCCQEKEI